MSDPRLHDPSVAGRGAGFAVLASVTAAVGLTTAASGVGANDPQTDDMACATIPCLPFNGSFVDTGDFTDPDGPGPLAPLDCNGNPITASRESGQLSGSPILDCPWAGAVGGIDVTYRYTPLWASSGLATQNVDVILCGAGFNTKVYVTDPTGSQVVACNDDACNTTGGMPFASQLSVVPLTVGDTYHITVDAYSAATTGGPYTLIVQTTTGCIEGVSCEPGDLPEGESYCDHCGPCDQSCIDDPVPEDTFNGDCATTASTIRCGDTICGTTTMGMILTSCTDFNDCDPEDPKSCDLLTGYCAAAPLIQDVDVYGFTLEQDAEVTVTTEANVQGTASFVQILDNNDPVTGMPYADCLDATVVGLVPGVTCSVPSTSVSLAAGSYFLVVTPGDPTTWSLCNEPYRITVECGPPPCPWDVSTDGTNQEQDDFVGVADLSALLNHWGACQPPPPVYCRWDFTGADGMPDGFVGLADLTEMLNHWGTCPGVDP